MNTQRKFYEVGTYGSTLEAKYTGPVPLENRETEDPPSLPKLDEGSTEAQVMLRGSTDPMETVSLSLAQPDLWEKVGTENPKDHHVILVPAPNGAPESIAFGLFEAVSTNTVWEVAFVARMKNDHRETFKASLASWIPVHELSTPPQDRLKNYLLSVYNMLSTTVQARAA